MHVCLTLIMMIWQFQLLWTHCFTKIEHARKNTRNNVNSWTLGPLRAAYTRRNDGWVQIPWRIIGARIDAIGISSRTYRFFRGGNFNAVPSPEEHLDRQDPGDSARIYRPQILLNIERHEQTHAVLFGLTDLGRTALAGREARPLNRTGERVSTDRYYMSLVVLNLGDLKRQAYFAGEIRYPSWIRNDKSKLRDHLFNSTAHGHQQVW